MKCFSVYMAVILFLLVLVLLLMICIQVLVICCFLIPQSHRNPAWGKGQPSQKRRDEQRGSGQRREESGQRREESGQRRQGSVQRERMQRQNVYLESQREQIEDLDICEGEQERRQGQKTRTGKKGVLPKMTEALVTEKEEELSDGAGIKRTVEEVPYYKEQIMEFIRNAYAGDQIRIDFLQNRKSDPYGFNKDFAESEEGNLVIYRKLLDGSYYVLPAYDHIGETECNHSALGSCYDIGKSVSPGERFVIVDVEKFCIMQKQGTKYILLEKGKLRVERDR